MSTAPTACILVIGNEILSGRTQDTNLNFIAKRLNDIGVRLREARVIPDVESIIVETVNACRKQYTYVFTTGGIGPTHDDITTQAVARAFGVPVLRHPEAERRLLAHYPPEKVNEARLKMADIPQGARLIDNPVSAAPGFYLENVFVMAGVPAIMRAMFDFVQPLLSGGLPMLSRSVSAHVTEGTLAAGLTAIQARYESIEIGSYPFIRHDRLGTSIVLRATDAALLEAATDEVRNLLENLGGTVWDEILSEGSS